MFLNDYEHASKYVSSFPVLDLRVPLCGRARSRQPAKHFAGKSWCREGELNPQGAKHRRILSPLRLPVPPSRPGKEEAIPSLIEAFQLCNRGRRKVQQLDQATSRVCCGAVRSSRCSRCTLDHGYTFWVHGVPRCRELDWCNCEPRDRALRLHRREA